MRVHMNLGWKLAGAIREQAPGWIHAMAPPILRDGCGVLPHGTISVATMMNNQSDKGLLGGSAPAPRGPEPAGLLKSSAIHKKSIRRARPAGATVP